LGDEADQDWATLPYNSALRNEACGFTYALVYCQSGARASVGAAMLRSLGFKNVRVFEESWLGYGNNTTAPAEAVQYFTFNTFAGKIKSLEAAVQNLTAEIKTLKAAKQ
jgi:hypothetical protein